MAGKPWGNFWTGLALGLFFGLFALFGLFFVKDSRRRKFFGIGAAVGIFAEIIIVAIILVVGVTAFGITLGRQ